MFTLNIEMFPPDLQKQLLTDEQVKKQVRSLGTPGGAPGTRKLINYGEMGLTSPPVAGRTGGQSVKRQWAPWTAAEYDVAMRLATRLSRAEIAEVRRLALILWSCGDYRDVLGHVSDFRGKEAFELFICYWLSIFCANLKFLGYDKFLHRQRLEYFEKDEGFRLLVWGLTHGFYEGYTVDKDGSLVRPAGREMPNPEQSLKGFPAAA